MNPRRALIDIGRRLWERRLVSGTDGNLSVRLGADRILATASGVPKGHLGDDDLVELSLDGRVLGRGKAKKPSSEIKMHLMAYRVRPDVAAVLHAHPPHATAFAAAGIGITSCVLPEIIVSLGSVPLVPYATPSTAEVPEAVARFLPGADAVLLENHGALTLGRDLHEAYYRMESIDQAAQILLFARLLGGPSPLSSAEVDKLMATRPGLGFSNPAPRCKAE